MKLLIVDDESIVRIGMRNVIRWEDHGYEVVGEARNGREALELARLYQPDIVLTDIVMPEMDGLDFIQKIKSELPKIKFIILSCHDDVSFYRKAIKLGVSEYIQKANVSPTEIMEAADRIADEIWLEQAKHAELGPGGEDAGSKAAWEGLLSFLIKGKALSGQPAGGPVSSLMSDSAGNDLYVLTFKAFFSDPAKSYDGDYDTSIVSVAKSIISDMTGGYVLSGMEEHIIAVIPLAKSENDPADRLQGICYRLNETMDQMFGVKLTFGVSVKSADPAGLHEAYLQAARALGESFVHGSGHVYFYDGNGEAENALAVISEKKDEIFRIASPLEGDRILEILRQIEDFAVSHTGITQEHLKPVYMDILYHIINRLRVEDIEVDDVMGHGFSTITYINQPGTLSELNARMQSLLEKIRQVYSIRLQARDGVTVSLIQSYIRDHICQRVTLEEIASAAHLSPGYTSRFYKKETGVTLQDYIISLKAEKSKELIRAGHSLSKVADEIGFSSDSHFFKVFKDYTGMTPHQYKEVIMRDRGQPGI